MTKKYEYTCPKCGAIALVWVDDITLNDEVVGQRTEVRCFSCNYKKVTYKAVPTAEIVYCKDCQWWIVPDGCAHDDGLITATANDFCSHAERRTDG